MILVTKTSDQTRQRGPCACVCVCVRVCVLCFRRLTLTDLVGGGGGDTGVSLLSAAALLACMSVDRESEGVGHCGLLRFHR